MTNPLLDHVAGLAGLRVLVVGDAMLDVYLSGSSERLSQEAPVPVVTVDAETTNAGGAANVAVNAARLGGDVSLVALVGSDADGERLLAELRVAGVATGGVVVDPSRSTMSKTRILANGQGVVRFDRGSTGSAGRQSQRRVAGSVAEQVAVADAVIVSDYAYGVVTDAVIGSLAERRVGRRAVVAVDSKDLTRYRDVAPTVVKPNRSQALRLLGQPDDGQVEGRIDAGADALLERTGARIVAVSLGGDGALVVERNRPMYRTYSRPLAQSRAAGAGDTFVAVLAMALATGAGGPAATELASAAATVVMGKEGTATCSASELRESLSGSRKLLSGGRLAARMAYHRSRGERIVLTNGCFDILHRGHVTYLNRAKALGDVLVVGVNSDESVRRLKGPGRPINALDDRVEVLAALSCVDHVAVFDEDTPARLVEAVRPDVFVKGGDYTREMLPEAAVVAAVGGAVRILPYVEDRSTTGVIRRIRATADEARRPAGG